MAEIAGCLMCQHVPALQNARALDNPGGVEAEFLVEVIVGDDGIGNVTAGAKHAHTRQTAATRTGQRSPFVIHAAQTV